MDIKNIYQSFKRWYTRKRIHWAFPVFTATIGVVFGMLISPIIGAIFLTLTLFSGLIIFVPWEKISQLRLNWNVFKWRLLPYVVSAIICLVIVIPFWGQIVSIFPSPVNLYRQPIRTVTATVAIYVSSNENIDGHFTMAREYLYFGKGREALLKTRANEYDVKQIGNKTVVYRGKFDMDADSNATQQSVLFLKQAEYIQMSFSTMPKEAQILDGIVIVMINDAVRLEIPIPPQQITEGRIFVRNIQRYLLDFN